MSSVRGPIRSRAWSRSDALVIGLYGLAAVYVTFPLWSEPGLRVGPLAQGDYALFEWFLAHGARAVTHLDNPFFSTQMNVPEGVNMMANTSMLGLSVPLAPVTLNFGPHISLLTLMTLALAGTAVSWYYVLSRHVVTSRFAAATGAWFCGFGPPMVAHVGSMHANLTFQVLVPIIVLQVMRLREPDRAFTKGLVLGLMIVYQAFISEEILFITALGCAVFLLIYSLQEPREFLRAWRPIVTSLSVTTIVAGVLLAYPLWVQFFGAHHYRGLTTFHDDLSLDLAAFSAFATESLKGTGHWINRTLLTIPSEENAFFGWPMLIVGAAAFVLSGRKPVARALRPTVFVFAILALGVEVKYRGARTGIPGPWRYFNDLPLMDSLTVSRFGFVVTVALSVLVALATQQVWDFAARRPNPTLIRGLWAVPVILALLPSAPTPVDVRSQPPIPRFFASNSWRNYVDTDETIVLLPFPAVLPTAPMRWVAHAGLDFSIPGGYFLYPEDGVDGRNARFGSPLRPTARLLNEVEIKGIARPISHADRMRAESDLRYWRASLIVLPATERNAEALRATVEALLGPGERDEDVWLWRVSDGVREAPRLG